MPFDWKVMVWWEQIISGLLMNDSIHYLFVAEWQSHGFSEEQQQIYIGKSEFCAILARRYKPFSSI